MANYLVYCIQNIEKFEFSDPFESRKRIVSVNVPSYIDSQFGGGEADNYATSVRAALEYRNFGMFTKEIRKRVAKANEKETGKQ